MRGGFLFFAISLKNMIFRPLPCQEVRGVSCPLQRYPPTPVFPGRMRSVLRDRTFFRISKFDFA